MLVEGLKETNTQDYAVWRLGCKHPHSLKKQARLQKDKNFVSALGKNERSFSEMFKPAVHIIME